MSEKEKSAGQLLKEKLFRSPKNAGSSLSEEEIKAAFDYCEPYKDFISTCKTECCGNISFTLSGELLCGHGSVEL